MTVSVRIAKRFPAGEESEAFSLDLNFEADPGVTVLFGASGAGKSLTLDCVAGFARPDAGRISVGERIVFDAATKIHLRPQQRECGYVFQNSALFPHMTLRENLAFAAERHSRLDRHRRVNEMIDRFRLSEIAGRKPRQLSGGQRQRCSIARALIAHPQALLLDEPARGLDAALRAEFHQLMRELRSEYNIPLLLVTHDLDEAVAMGDRMLVYQHGQIVQAGAPQDVLSMPASAAVSKLFGHINRLPATILALDPGRNTSRLRIENGEIAGPYFPGRLLGDRETLLVRADEIRLHATPGSNRVPARLEQRWDRAYLVELKFTGGIRVLTPRYELEGRDAHDNWYLEIPALTVRLAGPEPA